MRFLKKTSPRRSQVRKSITTERFSQISRFADSDVINSALIWLLFVALCVFVLSFELIQQAGYLKVIATTVIVLLISLAAAFIGTEAAIEFGEFCRNFDRQVTPEDIIVEGDFSKVESFGLNEHVALIMKMENNDLLAAALPENQIHNLAKYLISLPSEAAMKLWGAVGKDRDGSGKNRENVIKIHKAKVDGKMVKDYIVPLLSGKKEE